MYSSQNLNEWFMTYDLLNLNKYSIRIMIYAAPLILWCQAMTKHTTIKIYMNIILIYLFSHVHISNFPDNIITYYYCKMLK